MKYLPLFIAIQLASLVLTVVGIPVVAALAAVGAFYYDVQHDRVHFPLWAWIWDNEEDGVCASWYQLDNQHRNLKINIFMWSALRNPCNNLRFVPGVSKQGRPLFIRFYKGFYAEAGWNPHGYPVLSAGRS